MFMSIGRFNTKTGKCRLLSDHTTDGWKNYYWFSSRLSLWFMWFLQYNVYVLFTQICFRRRGLFTELQRDLTRAVSRYVTCFLKVVSYLCRIISQCRTWIIYSNCMLSADSAGSDVGTTKMWGLSGEVGSQRKHFFLFFRFSCCRINFVLSFLVGTI